MKITATDFFEVELTDRPGDIAFDMAGVERYGVKQLQTRIIKVHLQEG